MAQADRATETTGAGGTTAIVLAAGKSTRMRSHLPKGLHPICGRPILLHILHALAQAGVTRRIVVVGHQKELVQAALDAEFGMGVIEYVEQAEQRGTGHAVQMAVPLLREAGGTVLVVPGDTPLLTAEVLTELLAAHQGQRAQATLLTTVLPDAGAYGRVLRDADGSVAAIVEARDASVEQNAVREINTAVYAFQTPALLLALAALRSDNAQNEFYLTDTIGLIRQSGGAVAGVVAPDSDVVLGVNTRVELAQVGEILRRRLLNDLMLGGVTVVDPNTTYVDVDVTVGQESVLLPGTHLLGTTTVGANCVLGPNTYLQNVTVGDRVEIRASFGYDSVVGDGCRIGPFAHLRAGSQIGASVKLGNFVETKNSTLGDHVSAGHLTYLGDATVGAHSNIGGGTITCNFDGYDKHRTTIGERAFVGSNSSLVAPVTVGDNAFTAAGSAITDDVPANALAIARERQVVKEGWVTRYRTHKELKRQKGTKS